MITTKPPERRESVLPWHSIDKQNASHAQTFGSSQWQQSNVSSKPSGSGWALRRKTGDGIEQWTKVISPVYIPDQAPEKIPDQKRDVELGKPEQHRKNLKPSPECAELIEPDKNRGRTWDQSKHGRCGPPQNEIDFEHKQPPRTKTQYDADDLYEGVALDSTVTF